MYLILTLVLFKLGGGVSREFDSNSGISVNLSRDWTSLGWQVWKLSHQFFILCSVLGSYSLYSSCDYILCWNLNFELAKMSTH